MEEDGFQLVRSRRRSKKCQQVNSTAWTNRWAHNVVDGRPHSEDVAVANRDLGLVDETLKNIRRLTETLRSSDYVDTVAPLLRTVLRGLGKVNGSDAVCDSIVCYGLGNFSHCEKAAHQLALLLCLEEDLLNDERKGRVYLFDPVFTESERYVLIHGLGMRLIDKNELCGRKANGPTCFFMPHCDLMLYENLLVANVGEQLSDVILIGNSLPSCAINGAFPRGYFEATYGNIAKCLDILDEYPLHLLRNSYQNAFNNTSIHTFKRSTVSVLWQVRIVT